MVSALDAKDPHIRGHSERVALYARRLAKEVGLDELSCEIIYLAGLLHDVGKIGVPDVVLLKSGTLTEHESRVMQQHPDQGWSILQDVTQIKYVLPGVLHHHERFDGTGYLDSLAGSAIPLSARILSVVDAYDAMSHSRRYRQSLSHDESLQALREGAGTQWDPEIVEAFLAIVPDVISIRDSYNPPASCQRR
jgi:HD-GYP domain-containing protein (c-di-GMP phosphodiesterase class II)